jgi:hypothetical protein
MVKRATAARPRRPAQRTRQAVSAADTGWVPRDIDESLRFALGGSFVDEFVIGHRPVDVLRELVQNEFDADGQALTVVFSTDHLSVIGTGRPIGKDGWKRLNVLAGTGRVIGLNASGDCDEVIEPKVNGIGSKNFGLRSLFLFGNRIHVRSAGQVAVLDLPSFGTTRVRERGGRGGRGVSIHVDYRQQPFAKLPAFTRADEERAFRAMAGGMLPTLAKLALTGRKLGLRELTLRSDRLDQTIVWRQQAEKLACGAPGVEALRRTRTMVRTEAGAKPVRARFEEHEFARMVLLDPSVKAPDIPTYFERTPGQVRIAASLPIERGRPLARRTGRFFYPLQAPRGGTGTALDVSAPFELNGDRSALLDNDWNSWLAEQAAALVIDLLAQDWFDRFGAAGYVALVPREPVDPSPFAAALASGLAKAPCWPTNATDPGSRFATAQALAVPTHPALGGHLAAVRYLNDGLVSDELIKDMALVSGAKRFTLNSLVRLRCAAANASALHTKPGADEVNTYFNNYEAAMRDVNRQVAFAAALGKGGRLSNENRHDLKRSRSTLTRSLELGVAVELVRVDPALPDCPQPPGRQLHPALYEERAIAGYCQLFDEDKWVRDVCERAWAGTVEESERLAVEARLLNASADLGRRTWSAVRLSPVMRNHRGDWVAPDDMVRLSGRSAGFFLKVLSGPSRAMLGQPDLLDRLKVRTVIDADDLVRVAGWVDQNAGEAERFEVELARYQRLLTRDAVKRLSALPFLRTAAGTVEAPVKLHLNNPLNRLCIGPERIVGGSRIELYRSLSVRAAPEPDAILETISALAEGGRPPERADMFYAVVAEVAKRDQAFKLELAERSVLWAGGAYRRPPEVLADQGVARFFEGAIPMIRGPETLVRCFVEIGAATIPSEGHWRLFFESLDARTEQSTPISNADRRAVLDAYQLRGGLGLPAGLAPETRCLLDRWPMRWTEKVSQSVSRT